MKREANHKRQLQQREMTPDNLRVIEQKLIEFQQQQMNQEEEGLCNGHVENTNGDVQHAQYNQQHMQVDQHQNSQVMTQQHQVHQQQTQVVTQQQQSYEQQTQVIQQQQTYAMTQQQQSYEQQSQMIQSQQDAYQQQTQVHQQQSFQQQQTFQQQSSQQQHEQYQIMNNAVTNGFQKESSMPPIPPHQNGNGYGSGRGSVSNGLQHETSIAPIPQHQNGNGYGSGSGSVPREVRGGSEMTYMSLLPEDGSMPHRTNPIGDTISKRSQSVAATPDREIKRKWSISSSTDYLNKTNKGSYMVRNNPIGLAEPSVGRDGYAVGSREGSMYRSTGNVNVSRGTVGSRAASEAKDIPKGNWQGRRASTSDIKGSGIRVGGNLVEPSAKPQPNMCMPFGSSNKSGGYMKRRVNKTVQQSSQSSSTVIQNGVQESNTLTVSAQQITENKLKAKRERNRTISGDSVRTQTTSKTLTQQVGNALSGITTALEQIKVNESKQNVTMPLPRKNRRAQSLPRGQVSNEESSFKVSLPGSARASRQASVEPDHNRKKLSRHGSVEIFDGAYNLTVPNKLSSTC
eukprot:TRINITY_DN2626_c0_g1_i1.p1 TRINITY_DN2626_c0_g1~~TRINITY_DN2626_c0_g1_i1.p1  ORF type:complete len:570 (-),score=137.78 TRINITY_DN2626_c0_g1_i1:1892-3601(-)